MKSSLSFCNGTLLRKNLTRFAPLWGIYLAGVLLVGPVLLFVALGTAGHANRREIAEELLLVLRIASIYAHLIYALLTAGVCFKYLHKTRSAYMMHAFPVNRLTQFCTNVVSGLLFALVPQLLSAVLCLPVLALYGVPNALGLAGALLAHWVLQYLCFFGLAVFCMMLSGRTVIAALSYLAANIIGWALPFMVLRIVEPLFFGLDLGGSSFTFLSPMIQLSTQAGEGLLWPAVYGAVGLVLLALAWLHYRVRQLERTGEAMAYGWARVVFLLLFTLMAGLTVGWVLWMIFSMGGSIYHGVFGFCLCLCAGLFLGCFGARMMLSRTVRVFRRGKNWLVYGAIALAVVLCVLGVRFDVLGLQRMVPSLQSVRSVEIYTQESSMFGPPGDQIIIEDPQELQTVLALHREQTEQMAAGKILAEPDGFASNPFAPRGSIRYRVHLVYHLRGGLTIRRAYILTNIQEGSKLLDGLYAVPQRCEEYYARILPETVRTLEVYKTDTTYGLTGKSASIYPELRQAILADAAAGKFPIHCNAVRYNVILQSQEGDGHSYLNLDVPSTAAQTLALLD